MKALLEENPRLAEAHEKYTTFTRDEELRAAYEARMKGLRRENAQLVLSHKAALKAQEEMRKRSVLFMKKRGIPLSEIAAALGISQEEVERL